MPDLTEIRHHLHALPELSGREKETRQFIEKELEKAGIHHIHRSPNDHSLLAEIPGSHAGPGVLFRCEMDALPIEEINTFGHRSRNQGLSHACGHDGHMAIMLGFVQKLMEEPPQKGTVLVLFQAAEETGEGARSLIRSGLLESLRIDYVFALHNIPGFPLNTVICKPGIFTPAVESISIELIGKTSHAGEPGKGINPAETLAQILNYMNALHRPEKSDPDYCVCTPVQILMGEEAFGTSAGHAWIRYTIRTWRNERLNELKTRINQNVTRLVAMKKGLKLHMEWKQPFNANNNHPDAVKIIERAAEMNGLVYISKKEPFDWGEDFGLLTERYKGAMFGLGSGEEHPAVHSSDYDFPDTMIQPGIGIFQTISRLILM